jgi:hypothetical protein
VCLRLDVGVVVGHALRGVPEIFLAEGGRLDDLIEASTPRLVAPVQAELTAADPPAGSAATVAWDGDAATLLSDLHAALRRYVILPSKITGAYGSPSA